MPALTSSATEYTAVSRLISTATTNATSVTTSATWLIGWDLTNVNAAARFLKVYDKASAPTVGTDAVVLTLLIPGATTGGRAAFSFTRQGALYFPTGLAFGLVTGAADNNTTAVAASEIIVHLFYRLTP